MIMKDKLISKQQLEIQEYKEILEENTKLRTKLYSLLFSIGAPLNDNILGFNKDQLKWCMEIANLIEELN